MKVIEVTFIDYCLLVKFDNKDIKKVDLHNWLKKSKQPMTSKFLNKNEFAKVKIDMGFLSWNNGEMELSAESLYHHEKNFMA